MNQNGMYYVTDEFKQLIRNLGGEWNDQKKRPIVCLIQSSEISELYWAIPVGKVNHRDQEGMNRIRFFMSRPDRDLRSCYYHIGRTTNKSIFFISDTIPIIDKYILEEHLGADLNPYVIKNPILLSELQYKLNRILNFEASKQNYFRQHITDIKNHLIAELDTEKTVIEKNAETEVAITQEENKEEN